MHFRVKEITGVATVVRQVDNLVNLELGDFFYPEELDTLVVSDRLVYWNDQTGETFEVAAKPAAPEIKAPIKQAAKPAAVEGQKA